MHCVQGNPSPHKCLTPVRTPVNATETVIAIATMIVMTDTRSVRGVRHRAEAPTEVHHQEEASISIFVAKTDTAIVIGVAIVTAVVIVTGAGTEIEAEIGMSY